MKKSKKVAFFVLAITLLFSSTPVVAQAETEVSSGGNEYPLVFVHGLGGWGPNEMFGVNYWGGIQDILGNLEAQGFTTLQATVGPVSSNRDRAIELYYYLVGGTVDYGAAHSERHGTQRFGRTFPGIFPEWSSEERIHLIGHSMGGLTIREVANLIANGCPYEQAHYAANPEVGISPLLAGTSDRGIHSITTIATPNNGSSFAEDQNAFVPFMQTLITYLAGLAGGMDQSIYDLKLDQFGLVREPGETFRAYLNRVFNSPIWGTTNVANHDLSVYGVTGNAANLQTLPDIYYFSHTGQATEAASLPGRHRTTTRMNPLMTLPAQFMFDYRDPYSVPAIDDRWAANDGLVNTISSFYPFGHPAQPYDGSPIIGTWNYHPTMYGWDHVAFMGLGVQRPSAVNHFYLEMAERLWSLPQ